MIQIATIDDLDDLLLKFEPMKLNKDVLQGLVSANHVMYFKENETTIGAVATAISLNEHGIVGRVFGIWLLNQDHKGTVMNGLESIISQVLYSSICSYYLGYEPKYLWQPIDFCEDIKKKVVVTDASVLNYKFLPIKSSAINLVKLFDKADKTRDTYITQDMQSNFDTMYKNGLVELYNGVYTFPLLSKSMCKKILKDTSKYEYTTNSKEDIPYQMPEIVLNDVDTTLYNQLSNVYFDNIGVISQSMYGVEADDIRSIQLAKYSADGISKGNWHFDSDSDITVVVSLSDDYEGGGTMIKPYGDTKELFIPKLPVGHAIMFRGRHFMHKGLQVTKGSRDILVFWTMAEDV